MCEGLVDLIEQRAAGRRVTGVRLRIGARHAVVPEAFDQAFALAAEGSAAHGAALDLVVAPVMIACRSCGHRSESGGTLPVCDRCGGADVEVSGGDELVLESLQFDSVREEAADVPGHPG